MYLQLWRSPLYAQLSKDLYSSPTGQDPPPFVNPFNQGNSLFETPYSGSINAMEGGGGSGGFMQSMMTMTAGGGRNGLPSMFMKNGKLHMGQQQCLKNIVCPQYCHEIDQNGCETCPCGPANGMRTPGHVEKEQQQKNKQQGEENKKDKQCVQTLICMLSCKEGYELGKKGQDGCQTCKCVKKDDNKNTPKQTGQIGMEIMKNGTGNKNSESGSGSSAGTGSSGSGSGGQGPFGGASGSESGSGFNPMFPGAGMGSGSGSASGAGMPSPFGGGGGSSGMVMSPFGLAASGDVKSGRDCFGPECSAKNGMKLLGEVKPKEEDCPSTTLCIKTCKHDLKLGPKGSDGCPSCACVKSDISTTSTPEQKVCHRLVSCMMGCSEGYLLGAADKSGCPSCSCKSNPITTTASPVTQSSCQKIMNLCVRNCRYGYQLIPASTIGECASCLCQPAPTQPVVTQKVVVVHQHSCEDNVVRCMTNCRYGYLLKSTGSQQCPLCQCLPPPRRTESSIIATTTSKPNVYSILKNCPEAVHCMLNCRTGYALQSIPGQECPHCACHTVAVQTLVCTTALSCPRGCLLGYRNGGSGCPTCSCVIPSEVGITTHSAIYVESSIRCNAHFSCSQRCEFGYRSGDNSCPTCQCLVPDKVASQTISSHSCTNEGCQYHNVPSGAVEHVIVPHQPGSNSIPLGHVITNHQSGSSVQVTHVAGSHGEISSQNTISILVRYCTNVAHCVKSCPKGFSLTGTEAGKCPACTCTTGTITHLTESKLPTAAPVVHPPVVQVKPTATMHHTHRPDIHTMCPETFRCGEKCGGGFTLKNEPGNTCPTCYCIAGKIESTDSPHLIHSEHAGSHININAGGVVSNVIPVEVSAHNSHSLVGAGNQVVVPTSGAVNNGYQGVPSGPGVHFNILHGLGGTILNGPDSSLNVHEPAPLTGAHTHFSNQNCVGPACSAINGFHKSHTMTSSRKHTPPNQCAGIIHCVLTCHAGYRLTDKDEHGCPGCVCLPDE
ncbi:uncharacterized protein LOC133193148 [Saccostrea echinata]|uniref:uncharacterized protein LOC133193148 n=1 Tax=Saccostrea echinata TaxID=191078 RepID=UPI002A818EE9|nr:uncharacterized protein LOC133193148 [Saccostrea echinata]